MNFLNQLRNNPSGWGPSGPSLDPAYDAPVQPGDETWRGMMLPLRTVAEPGAPDRMEFAVPSTVWDTWDAVTAPGRAYYNGMTDKEINVAGVETYACPKCCGNE